LRRLTERTKRALLRAESHAARLGADSLAPEHILLSIVDDADTLAVRVIVALGADPARIRADLDDPQASAIEHPPAVPVGPAARRSLDAALTEALQLGHNYIGTEHLLLGLLHEERRALAGQGITLSAARDKVRDLINELLRGRG
jgi:ATP-dependent Clp protease ATP-binding subunit ClpA